MKDCIVPRLDIECKSMRIDLCGGSFQTPVTILLEVDEIEEDDYSGRGEKRALEIDARGSGVDTRVTHVPLAIQYILVKR